MHLRCIHAGWEGGTLKVALRGTLKVALQANFVFLLHEITWNNSNTTNNHKLNMSFLMKEQV